MVLSALVVNAREPLSTEVLADALWGDALPASWAKVVRYRLTLGDDELDHRLFERLLERGREALAGDGARLLDTATFEWVGEESTIAVGENVSYSPDGSQFASVVADWVRIWDGRTGAYRAGVPLPGATSGATVSFLPDGTGLLVSTLGGRTWIVNTRLTTWVQRSCRIAGAT